MPLAAITPLQTGLAVLIAAAAAVMFGAAAVFQQRAIQQNTNDADAEHTLSVRQILALFKLPRWRTGLLLIGGGTALHVVALALAPLKVIQPIGVLAVPAAIIIASAHEHRRPEGRVLIGVAVSLAAIVGFVLLAATPDAPSPQTDRLLTAAVAIFVVSGLLYLVSRRARSWLRCVALAAAGAINFGLGSALVRSLTQLVTQPDQASNGWVTAGLLACMCAAVALGGWFLQQAYAAGAAAVVTACSTVVDPLIAVLIGITVLGEGQFIDGIHATGMILTAAVASAGVFYLARHHPDHRHPAHESPTPPLAGVTEDD